jgi:hypothetical protein
VIVVSVTHLAGGPSCALSPPVPTLNAQLRSLGGFDQPYDANNVRALESLATQAAGALSPNLIGATAASPVSVTSLSASRPDAVVVPLTYPRSSANAGRIAGLVTFLRDCTGRVYFSTVDDLSGAAAPAAAFPAVDQSAAAARLGSDAPQLVYADSPFAPSWRNAATGAMISAG